MITSIATITGLALREAREILGYGLTKAAKRLCLTENSLGRYEVGQGKPSLSKLYEFAGLLGFDLMVLINRVEEVRTILEAEGWHVSPEVPEENDDLLQGILYIKRDGNFFLDKRDDKHNIIPEVRSKYLPFKDPKRSMNDRERRRSCNGCPFLYAIYGAYYLELNMVTQAEAETIPGRVPE